MARLASSIWHLLGEALERAGAALVATSEPPTAKEKLRWRGKPSTAPGEPWSEILLGTGTALFSAAAFRWSRSHTPPARLLVRGAAAGAGAALALVLLRLLRERGEGGARPDATELAQEVSDELLAGAGRGVLYAALLHPLLPGPPLLRGALAGTADYLASPLGGVFSQLQPLSPIRRVPVISVLLEIGDVEESGLLPFILQGAILGALYGDPRG